MAEQNEDKEKDKKQEDEDRKPKSGQIKSPQGLARWFGLGPK